MFKKMMLVLAFSLVSCTQNIELATYDLDGKTQKLMSKGIMEDMVNLFGEVNSQEMLYILSDPNVFKMIVQNRTFEAELVANEASKISNYQEAPTFIDTIEYRKKALPVELSYKDGIEKISNEILKQTVEISEVSRIMFTNKTDQIDRLLAELKASDDIVLDFALKAEEFSHEPLGAQNGGYLGHISKRFFPVVDDIVFNQKYEGLYNGILRDNHGYYLILIHSPVRQVKVENFEKEGVIINPNNIMMNYINDSVEYLYTIVDQGVNRLVSINGTLQNMEDVDENESIVKIWGKEYSSAQLIEHLKVLMGGNVESPLTTRDVFVIITPSQSGAALALQRLSIILKGENKNRENSKEYKKMLKDSIDAFELETVYKIVIDDIYKDISTNVSSAEIAEFYSDVNNREVKSYSDEGTPIFATLEESSESIKQAIISMRMEAVQMQFMRKLEVDYNIAWNEDNFLKFMVELQIKYDKYLSDNHIDVEGELF